MNAGEDDGGGLVDIGRELGELGLDERAHGFELVTAEGGHRIALLGARACGAGVGSWGRA
jgi:hypothetical protein